MHLELTDEQESFKETTARFIATETPLTRVRDLYGSIDGFDRDWWRTAAELGWTSLLVPESLGGGSLSGQPVTDALIVAELIGRSVAPGPFIPTNLVAAALAMAGDAHASLIAEILSGTTVAAWAHSESTGLWDVDSTTTTARLEDDDVVLDGAKAYVEAAGSASHFLVTARTGDGCTLVLVPAEASGVTVTRGRSVDFTRRFGRVDLAGVRVGADALIGVPGEASIAVDRLLQIAVALQCAQLIGVADRTLQVTLEYGADRFAFGRPIVSFQALKHRIAEMTVKLEGSKAVTLQLAAAIDSDEPDCDVLASVAKAYVAEHCTDIVDDCVQITGGIGVTWEHDIHLYSRRAVVDRAVYGSPEEHKHRIMRHLEGAQT